MTTTTPLPAVPKTTPAWLIRGVSAALVVAGPAITWVDPGGHLDTGAIEAAIILVFLLLAFLLFAGQVLLAAVHEYGWSRAALLHVEPELIGEARTLEPEASYYASLAAPLMRATIPKLYDTAENHRPHTVTAVEDLADPAADVPPSPTVGQGPVPETTASAPVPSAPDTTVPAGSDPGIPVVVAAPVAADGTVTSP